jgi:hypothetical protein
MNDNKTDYKKPNWRRNPYPEGTREHRIVEAAFDLAEEHFKKEADFWKRRESKACERNIMYIGKITRLEAENKELEKKFNGCEHGIPEFNTGEEGTIYCKRCAFIADRASNMIEKEVKKDILAKINEFENDIIEWYEKDNHESSLKELVKELKKSLGGEE